MVSRRQMLDRFVVQPNQKISLEEGVLVANRGGGRQTGSCLRSGDVVSVIG